MAYDKGMADIVELIDYKNNDLFFFIKLRQRFPRYRKGRSLTPEMYASSDTSIEQIEDEVMYTLSGEEIVINKKSSELLRANSVSELKLRGRSRSSADILKRSSSMGRKSSTAAVHDSDSGLFSTASHHTVREHRSKSSFPFIIESSSSKSLIPSMDEGYVTESIKSSPSLFIRPKDEQEKKDEPIKIRKTKTVRDRQKLIVERLAKSAKSRRCYEKPMASEKVRTYGSYFKESPKWHENNLHRSSAKLAAEISTNVKTWKPKQPEHHYTRLTKSAYTKRKLTPAFTRAYTDLGFVDPSTKKTPGSATSTRTSSPALHNSTHSATPESSSVWDKQYPSLGSLKLNTYNLMQDDFAKLKLAKSKDPKELENTFEIVVASHSKNTPRNKEITKVL